MAEMLQMLALSPTMETGTIVKWNRAEGETFSSGDVLCEVETDKATMEYEAASDGTLRKITAPAGSKVRVGDLIAINATADEDISGMLASAAATAQDGEVPSSETSAPDTTAGTVTVTGQGENSHLPDGVRASPLARKIARERGINLR